MAIIGRKYEAAAIRALQEDLTQALFGLQEAVKSAQWKGWTPYHLLSTGPNGTGVMAVLAADPILDGWEAEFDCPRCGEPVPVSGSETTAILTQERDGEVTIEAVRASAVCMREACGWDGEATLTAAGTVKTTGPDGTPVICGWREAPLRRFDDEEEE